MSKNNFLKSSLIRISKTSHPLRVENMKTMVHIDKVHIFSWEGKRICPNLKKKIDATKQFQINFGDCINFSGLFRKYELWREV